MRRRTFATAMVSTGLVAVTALAGCGGPSESDAPTGTTQSVLDDADATEHSSSAASDQEFPDVLDAELTRSGDELRIAVTISSPYDTPERYADG